MIANQVEGLEFDFGSESAIATGGFGWGQEGVEVGTAVVEDCAGLFDFAGSDEDR